MSGTEGVKGFPVGEDGIWGSTFQLFPEMAQMIGAVPAIEHILAIVDMGTVVGQ